MSGRPPGSVEPAAERATERRHRSFLSELVRLALLALVLALLLRTFVVQAFYIPSPSMTPTLGPGDRVLVNKLVYAFGDVRRFDVVVFRDPRGEDRGALGALVDWFTEGFGAARPAHEDFVKRVLALPGETWEIREGRLYVDGEFVPEPYLDPALDERSFDREIVPEGMLFVLGDNRLVSEDSRFPDLGYVPVDDVVGKAFLIVWPPSRIGWIRKP